MSTQPPNQKQLAERWGISPETLERWLGQGPKSLNLRGRIAYRLEALQGCPIVQTAPPHVGTIVEQQLQDRVLVQAIGVASRRQPAYAEPVRPPRVAHAC